MLHQATRMGCDSNILYTSSLMIESDAPVSNSIKIGVLSSSTAILIGSTLDDGRVNIV